MQRAEMEELRHREANNTALQAIGPRKKLKLDPEAAATTVSFVFTEISTKFLTLKGFQTTTTTGNSGATPKSTAPLRPRIKRVNMRDMIFYMEQEKDSCRSNMLYKAYLK